jgi:hypothetical protein
MAWTLGVSLTWAMAGLVIADVGGGGGGFTPTARRTFGQFGRAGSRQMMRAA